MDHYKRYGGGWAVVTGATDGIGKAYCDEFAKSGFNIVLMARNSQKLEKVATEIQNKYKVLTKVIVYDFGKLSTLESANDLKSMLNHELKDIDISILANNVGEARVGNFHKRRTWDVMSQINVNINS